MCRRSSLCVVTFSTNIVHTTGYTTHAEYAFSFSFSFLVLVVHYFPDIRLYLVSHMITYSIYIPFMGKGSPP
jgi:uncharacterized membrane protein YagU involved in acid resistance